MCIWSAYRSAKVRQQDFHSRRRPLISSPAPMRCMTCQSRWQRSRGWGGCSPRVDNWWWKISHGVSTHSPGQLLSGCCIRLKEAPCMHLPCPKLSRFVNKRSCVHLKWLKLLLDKSDSRSAHLVQVLPNVHTSLLPQLLFYALEQHRIGRNRNGA